MNISKETIVRIAQGFGGLLRNASSLDFALEKQEDKKLGEYKKLAYLLSAILVDHPFSDGNKKTAAFVALAFAEQNKKHLNILSATAMKATPEHIWTGVFLNRTHIL